MLGYRQVVSFFKKTFENPFDGKKKIAEPEKKQCYVLHITYKNGRFEEFFTFGNPPRGILKCYFWFLQRKSELYNLRYDKGMTVIIRSEVVRLSYSKQMRVEK
jgi:hypothetical protein